MRLRDEMKKVTQYRAIKSVCKITGRESYAIETKRDWREWQYNQHVGNEVGLKNFREWADKQGWQLSE